MTQTFRRYFFWVTHLTLHLALGLLTVGKVYAEIKKEKFSFTHNEQQAYLLLHILDDDLLHAEYAMGEGPDADVALYSSPMVFKKDSSYKGPGSYRRTGNRIETSRMRLNVDTAAVLALMSRQCRTRM